MTKSILPLLLAFAFYATPRAGFSAVTEPNGIDVPAVSSSSSEQSLQSFFDAEGEQIDAVSDASAVPGAFSPLCDFEGALVLSEAAALAGINWYNVDEADPTRVPTESELFPLVPIGAALGETFGSSDIRDNPNYAGGLIGFALMKDFSGDPSSPTPVAVYFSEYERNAFCSQCSAADYWKMALSYPSTVDANVYYLAFEDWEGAGDTGWGGNDGDFNDKVFEIRGVICVGGGEPCDTGLPGVCSGGLTECQPGGTLECEPQIESSPEVCDNLDNNCDGVIDGAPDLCSDREICFRGRCVPSCTSGEFRCEGSEVCENGVCIERACQGIVCSAGQICQSGQCVGGCTDVTCPIGQYCNVQLGLCIAPCDGVVCGIGEVCENGVCVVGCACSGCDDGDSCTERGECVDAGCESVECTAGFACVEGECVDACAGAVCPGGAACTEGQCGTPNYEAIPDPGADEITIEPPPASDSSGGAGNPGDGQAGAELASGGRTTSGLSGSSGESTSEASSSGEDSGCGCSVPVGREASSSWVALGLLVGALTLGRRRKQANE